MLRVGRLRHAVPAEPGRGGVPARPRPGARRRRPRPGVLRRLAMSQIDEAVQAARRRRRSHRGRDRQLAGQAGRHGQGQRHHRRDRDRQVAGRAALPVRRHGAELLVRRADRRRSAPRSSRSTPAAAASRPHRRRARRRRRRRRRRAPRRRRRSRRDARTTSRSSPGSSAVPRRAGAPRCWSATARARPSQAPAPQGVAGRPAAPPRLAQKDVQWAVSLDGEVAGTPARRADSATPDGSPPGVHRHRPRRPRRPGCWPSRRCASSPRTSASTWPRSPQRSTAVWSPAPTSRRAAPGERLAAAPRRVAAGRRATRDDGSRSRASAR